ncbi:MAG: sodium:solute symporter family transporter [Syntrophomonadaceae bacterium]
MKHLNSVDFVVISLYLSVLVGLSLYLKRRASGSLEDYFLGANKLPWWAMGISGMSSYIDMAGTMLIVSFLYMMGPRGLYIEFRGGAVLVLTFMLLWSGKWHHRSGCMTGAEWMEFRFGNNWGGRFARLISAVSVIVTTIGMLAYLIKALGMFTSMFLPYSPAECALIMIAVATVYTMISGFYGVVFTDLFQSVIVISMIILISVMAFMKISASGDLAQLAHSVTGNNEWVKSTLKWQVTMPRGYESYQDLTLFAFFYLLRNVFIGASTAGADPKYFGARNERECGSLSFLWTSLMMFRWPMMIGFAVLGIFLVNSFFPDQSVLIQAAELIKQHVPHISREHWSDTITAIMNSPASYPPELLSGIKNLLHDDWQSKLTLLSYDGTINTERIVPAVILFQIPEGVRGFLFIAFIAAALSAFNSGVNMTTAYFTRDIYQRYLRIKAKNRELLLATYCFTVILVSAGYVLAYNVNSINQIWGWIIMGLGGGLAVPALLKFYWWRYNGGGFAIGTAVGIVTAILQTKLFPGLVEWQQFLIVSVVSLAATVAGTYLTAPTDDAVLNEFYRKTRPFGLWKPYKERLEPGKRKEMEKEHRNDILAVPFTLVWQITLFLLPMQLMVRSYGEFSITLLIFVVCLAGMYWFWYRNLPKKKNMLIGNEMVETVPEEVV